jgi:putative RNA 2'-phosphotransferase
VADRLTDLSKLVSYALRHRPWEFELELDADGWTPVEQLVDALRGEPGWESLQVADLEAMVAAAARSRHELRDGRIRARYGHSVPGRIEHEAEPAPGRLFHGTARSALSAIARDGLLPRRRQYVHLARGPDLAAQIGRRRDNEPVVLEIDGTAAAAGAVRFFRAGDDIVLAERIPPEFIRGLDRPR